MPTSIYPPAFARQHLMLRTRPPDGYELETSWTGKKLTLATTYQYRRPTEASPLILQRIAGLEWRKAMVVFA